MTKKQINHEQEHKNEVESLEILDEITWEVPEYENFERTSRWYIIAGVIALFLMIYSFFTQNLLFALIFIISAVVVLLHDGREPEKILISITHEGLWLGKTLYDYDIMKDFAIIFKPREDIKMLYFEFKNVFRPRISISIEDQNPLLIREYLLQYLPEDLDRIHVPLSETLSKLLKL